MRRYLPLLALFLVPVLADTANSERYTIYDQCAVKVDGRCLQENGNTPKNIIGGTNYPFSIISRSGVRCSIEETPDAFVGECVDDDGVVVRVVMPKEM